MRLEILGDNIEQRAETARRAVGMIFGPNPATGPVRMAPEAIRRWLTADWPGEVLDVMLRRPPRTPTGDSGAAVVDIAAWSVSMTHMEVYHDGHYAGAAVQMDNDSLRALHAWEEACAAAK